MRRFILLLVIGASFAVAEEALASMDAGTLAHRLDRLRGTGRALYIAAHPDDENTRLLTYLTNGRHVTAIYLSMTRGGGGQNRHRPDAAALFLYVWQLRRRARGAGAAAFSQ